MNPSLRKIALTAHIVFSVGWLGAVLPYLALAIAGLSTPDAQMARGAYLSMSLIGWTVLVPLSFAALLSGVVQSLGTAWGLFRHWWVVAKLALTAAATFILLGHMQTVDRMARIAAETSQLAADFHNLRVQLIVHPAGGLLVLLAITVLSVFKPWGAISRTPRGIAPEALPSAGATPLAVRELPIPSATPHWARIVGYHAIGLAVLFIIFHIAGGGLSHHGH